MKVPSTADDIVQVSAYLTDQTFGYDHWRAAQFSAPPMADGHPALLVICATEDDRAEAERRIRTALGKEDR